MAKAIKRVGVIFLAVAIICLMAIGVILGVNGAKSETAGSLNLNNEIENVSETSEVEIPPISEEVLLDGGNCTEQAAKWTEAITKSLANDGGNHILVTLTKDWVAPNSGNHNFGEGVGFSNGSIYIPANAVITLDLNGHKIDRALTSAIAGGCVILIDGGTLLIKDNQFDYSKMLNAYKADPNTDLVNLFTGKITGGNNDSDGGGIFIMGSGANVIFESGVLSGNTSRNGGGICTRDAITLIINGGLFAENHAHASAGALFAANNSTLIINNGIFHKNICSGGSGGAIFSYYGKVYINGGIFSYNHAQSSKAEGGAIFIDNSDTYITDCLIEYNTSVHCGGGIRIGGAATKVVRITGGVYVNNATDTYSGGIRIAVNIPETCLPYLENCLVYNNTCKYYGGGITFEVPTSMGAGMQVYDNHRVTETENIDDNLYLINRPTIITITENLMKDGKNTFVKITADASKAFTKGYTTSGNTLTASRFFSSDIGKGVGMDGGEARISTTVANLTTNITWYWGNNANEQSVGGSNVTLPYKDTGYTIRANVAGVKNDKGEVKTSFSVKEPGYYSFYVDDAKAINPTFKVTIEKPKKEINKPKIKNYVFLFDDSLQVFYPEGFDSNTMDIGFNRAKEVGKYKATIKLKDVNNTIWSDVKNYNSFEIAYEIIPRGIEGKDGSNYSHIYLDNGYRKSYEDKYEHLINDKEVETSQGKYVLGNILAQTSVKAFINNLRNESNKIKLYDNNNTLVYDGIASGGVVADSLNNIFVATGYKVEYYYNNNLYDTMYLSILGDVVADGVINTLDVTYINRIAKGEIALSELSLEQQLATMVDNKGKVTSTDGKILLNVIGGNTQTNSYFESNANITNDYMLWDLSIDSVTGKTYRVGSEIKTASLVNNAIIGNIAPNTKASEFKTKLASQLGVDIRLIAIYKANGAVVNDSDYIGTGCYINYNGNTADKIYLSVLGDLTGDGVVNTADITYLNRIVNGNVELATGNIKDKLTILSASIQNKGNITTADSETLWNYIGGIADLTKYF